MAFTWRMLLRRKTLVKDPLSFTSIACNNTVNARTIKLLHTDLLDIAIGFLQSRAAMVSLAAKNKMLL